MALPTADATRATLGLLTRQQGPEDFPFSPALSRGLGVAAALTGALELALQTNGLAALVAAGVQVLVIHWLLGRWLGRQGLANRLPQTFGALMACTAVLNLVEWPVLAALAPALRQRDAALQQAASVTDLQRLMETMAPPPPLPTLGLMLIVLWGVAVKTRLLERALNVGFWRSLWRLIGLLLAASILGGLVASFFMTDGDHPRPPRAPVPPTAATPRPATS